MTHTVFIPSSTLRAIIFTKLFARASGVSFDSECMGGFRGGGQGVRTPLKNHKNIGVPCNTVPDPLKKSQSYQASI